MAKLPPKRPSFGGKPRAFNRPPNKEANKEYGGLVPKKASKATGDFDQSQGNRETGFIQNTERKATGGGPGRKPPATPGQFKAMSAPGNRDFGLIGASAPAPMTPDRVPRNMGEMDIPALRPKSMKKKRGF